MSKTVNTIEDFQRDIVELKNEMAPHEAKWDEWAYGTGVLGKRNKIHFFVTLLTTFVAPIWVFVFGEKNLDTFVFAIMLGFASGFILCGMVLMSGDSMYEDAVDEFEQKISQKRKKLVELTVGANIRNGHAVKGLWQEITFEFDDRFEKMYINIVDHTREDGTAVEVVEAKPLSV